MRVPIRKAGKYSYIKPDPYMTEAKLAELKNKLASLKKRQPDLAKEVKRLAAMGDFSENAAYQIAKGQLRSTNNAIESLDKQIAKAQIIKEVKNSDTIQIGSSFVLDLAGQKKEYKILGSLESEPNKGIISYSSPLGKELLNKKTGDIVQLQLEDKKVDYKIIKIL